MTEPARRDITTYTKLSDILSQFPADRQHKAYQRLKRQIKGNQLHAVLTLDWVLIPQKEKQLRVSELLIDIALDAWVQHTLEEFAVAKKWPSKKAKAKAEQNSEN